MSSPPIFTIDEYVRVSSGSESEDEDDGVPVELPANCTELMQLYRADSKKCKNLYGLIKNGLNYGRSFNSIILLVYGETHAGKSMTINKLFNDPNLCPINPFKSETHDMIIYQKKLLVKDSQPPVYGYLRFIDTPGTFDSEGKDEENMKMLNAFRKQSPMLSSSDRNHGLKKTLAWGTKLKIRSKVYPNVVLFFVSADGKTQGNRTRLRSSLQVLKETGFVDTKYQNLIVVVTRAAQLIEFGDEEDAEREKNSFLINSSKLETIITDAVHEVLGIDASVVFVENKPQRLLKKPDNSDYYMLPDGKFSHHNLLDAIINCFQKREFNDVLGKLLMGCYLDPSCPERSPTLHPIERMIFTPSRVDQRLVETELAMEAINLNEALPSFTQINNDLPEPKFIFEYLGHGICQGGSGIKSTSLLGKKEYQKFSIGSKQFCIPAELEIIPKKSTSINLFKLDSLINETTGSNLSFGAKLILPMMRTFNLNFDRGATRNESSSGTEVYVYQFEKILSVVKLDEPENMIENCCSTFKNHFLRLTGDEVVNDNDFPSFFERWGTHFITQQAVGGGIYIFYTFAKQMTADNKAGLEAEFGALFNGIEGNASLKAGETINNLRKRGVQNERILILGGSLEDSVFNFESLMKDKDILTRWNQSIENEPVSLVSETTFFPYFQLVSGDSNKQLRFKNATNEYVDNFVQEAAAQATPAIQQPLPVVQQQLETTQKSVAEELKRNAMEDNKKQKEESGGCFPSGTRILVHDTESPKMLEKPIETLRMGDGVQTLGLKLPTLTARSEIITTRMCTYIHKAPNQSMSYLVLSFANGHELVVSDLHLIFIIQEGILKARKAIEVVVGDSAVFCTSIHQPQITSCVSVSRKNFMGVFAPLTTSGTFLANGFLVTCYSNVDSFQLGQIAMAPLKVWSHSKSLLLKNLSSKGIEERRRRRARKEVEKTTGIHPFATVLMQFRDFGKKLY